MYCKECGSPLKENEFKCGADQTAEASGQEESGKEKTPVHHTEFTWNVYDFPKPKKTEELNLEWARQERPTAKKEAAAAEETAERKAEETDSLPLTVEPEKKAEAEAVREASVRKVEKFFTFTKKNEEFQRLLDQEYEKLKSRKEGEPYIDDDFDFGGGLATEQLSVFDAESELAQMIMEGTTEAGSAEAERQKSAEIYAEQTEMSRRRTIPVDLGKIQEQAEKMRREESGQDRKSAFDAFLDTELSRTEVEGDKRSPVPEIALSRKSVEDIVAEYESLPAQEANEAGKGATQEIAAEEKADDPVEEAVPEVMGAREATPRENSEQEEAEEESEEEAPEEKIIPEHLLEMEAARERLLRQLNEEREALRKAEAEAEARKKIAEELRASRSEQPTPEPAMTTVSQTLSGANAEIQVTVAVKASGGMAPQTYVNAVGIPRPEPAKQPEPDREQSDGVGYAKMWPPEKKEAHIVDAEVVTAAVPERPMPEPKTEPREQKQEAEVKGEEEKPWRENTFNKLWPAASAEETEEEPTEEEEEGSRGSRVGKVILILIVIVLIVEIAALGIKHLAPDSGAAEAVRNAEVKVVEVLGGAADTIKDFFEGASGDDKDGVKGPAPGSEAEGTGSSDESGESASGNEGSAQPLEPDPAPMADKTALIATKLSLNQNIASVIATEERYLHKGRDYGVADINQSSLIENNIWKQTEDGKTLYYDREIVGALISYDSAWINYVNSKDRTVFQYIKEGSRAYRLAESYSKVGKVKKSFESLEVGEIRQGEKGFYVWTVEKIKTTQNGNTTKSTNFWLYTLEPGANSMKIVDFIEY